MSHTYYVCYFHCIFSTKGRRNSIPDEIRPKLWAYIEGTAKNLGVVPVAIGGTSNHAHLLLGLRPNSTIAEAVQKLKANSSRWLGEHGLAFEWQKGYAVVSVSPSLVGTVRTLCSRAGGASQKAKFRRRICRFAAKSRHCTRCRASLCGLK